MESETTLWRPDPNRGIASDAELKFVYEDVNDVPVAKLLKLLWSLSAKPLSVPAALGTLSKLLPESVCRLSKQEETVLTKAWKKINQIIIRNKIFPKKISQEIREIAKNSPKNCQKHSQEIN